MDLWCKNDQENSVYADITRVGVAAGNPTGRQQTIFLLVKRARDEAAEFIKSRYENHIPIHGWEVDQVCRDLIEIAEYGEDILCIAQDIILEKNYMDRVQI